MVQDVAEGGSLSNTRGRSDEHPHPADPVPPGSLGKEGEPPHPHASDQENTPVEVTYYCKSRVECVSIDLSSFMTTVRARVSYLLQMCF